LHNYGRQLLNQKKLPEAFEVFQKNFTKHKGAWPTNVGMMRIYSAMGDYKKALEHAKAALPQALDEPTKKFLENSYQNTGTGKLCKNSSSFTETSSPVAGVLARNGEYYKSMFVANTTVATFTALLPCLLRGVPGIILLYPKSFP
jgi:tetratricopeptide (TPR) repeat protein